jgi:hypothetical protein
MSWIAYKIQMERQKTRPNQLQSSGGYGRTLHRSYQYFQDKKEIYEQTGKVQGWSFQRAKQG